MTDTDAAGDVVKVDGNENACWPEMISDSQRAAGRGIEWRGGVPILSHATFSFACSVERSIAIADHRLVVGAPWQVQAGPAADGLVLHRRRSHRLESSDG